MRWLVPLLCLCACDTIGEAPVPAVSDAGADASVTLMLPWLATPMPVLPEPIGNPSTEEKRALGRLLFYDPILSSDRKTACVTCHSEVWGLGDQLPRSVGVDGKGPIGPGRIGPKMTRRNSPALWNVGFREALFWDGRVSSLEEQVIQPLEEPEELARDPEEAIREIAAIPAYETLFAVAFPGETPAVSLPHLAQALAVFVRAFVADRTPYDRYLGGDLLALSPDDLQGMALFAELGCASCHVPPRFDSDQYADRHVPNPEGIVDDGRLEHSGLSEDRSAFRVPTLRNLRFSPPYFHNGAIETFERAIDHELSEQVENGQARTLDPQERAALIGFLRRALVDISREQYRPESVPSGLAIPPDGDRLVRGVHAD